MGDHQALRNNEASLWNHPIGRRAFLKKTGAASVATLAVMEGFRLEVGAAIGYYGPGPVGEWKFYSHRAGLNGNEKEFVWTKYYVDEPTLMATLSDFQVALLDFLNDINISIPTLETEHKVMGYEFVNSEIVPCAPLVMPQPDISGPTWESPLDLWKVQYEIVFPEGFEFNLIWNYTGTKLDERSETL